MVVVFFFSVRRFVIVMTSLCILREFLRDYRKLQQVCLIVRRLDFAKHACSRMLENILSIFRCVMH